MSIFYDNLPDPNAPAPQPEPYYGTDMGFWEAAPAMFDSQTRGKNTDTYYELLSEKLSPVIKTLEERSGKSFDDPSSMRSVLLGPTMANLMDQSRKGAIDRIFSEIRENPDLYPEYQNLTPEGVDAEIKQTALSEIKRGENVSQRTTTMGAVGGFIGTVGGLLVDDDFAAMNVMTAPIGFGVGLFRQMAGNALLSAGQEAILQPEIKKWYESLGLEYSWEEVYANITGAALFGAAFPAGIRAISLTNQQVREGIQAYRKAGLVGDNEANMLDGLADDADIVAQKPSPDIDNIDHIARVESATADVIQGRLPELGERGNPRERLPEVIQPDAQDINALAKTIDDIPDDLIIYADDEITGEARGLLAADLKAAIRQDDALLDRLRGCVVR